MFDWFWEFLYGISRSILTLIDGLMQCANKLCGIDPISVNGEETDFLTYLLKSDTVLQAFGIAASLGIIVLVFFTIFAIIRTVAREKMDISPAQICVKAFKSVLMFLFIPAVMFVLVIVLNAFMQALYKATLSGSGNIGDFLFTSFAQDAGLDDAERALFLNGTYSYKKLADVEACISLSDFDYFTSWVAGVVILFSLAWALIVFVDRAISIVVLFIVSPFSVASSVIDDGERFKLWRNQVLVKFLIGFGTILTINIYGLIVSLVSSSAVVFFENDFLNSLSKIMLIIGGALTMRKSMALIGNLVSSGAGSADLRDTAFGRGQLLSGLGMAASTAGKGLWGGAKWLGGKASSGYQSARQGIINSIAAKNVEPDPFQTGGSLFGNDGKASGNYQGFGASSNGAMQNGSFGGYGSQNVVSALQNGADGGSAQNDKKDNIGSDRANQVRDAMANTDMSKNGNAMQGGVSDGGAK